MQTFLPYVNFKMSAACLDNKRLGKQRVEAKQIYLALTEPTYGWKNHPAVKMWKGHEKALAFYGYVICEEWRWRGFNDSLLLWFLDRMDGALVEPPWLGCEAFHLSHQSNLLRKDPLHYGKFFPNVSLDLPYIWPSNLTA